MGRRHGMVVAAALAATALVAGQPVAATAASAPRAVKHGQAALTASEARALSTNVTDRVIVVFKDQATATPDSGRSEAARAATFASAQRTVALELGQTHAKNVHAYRLIDAMSATVSRGEAARLAANPAVRSVVPDEIIPVASAQPVTADDAGFVGTPVIPPGNACEAKGGVQLNPQADEAVDARSQDTSAKTAASLGYTGAGVKVAYIADGVDTDNPEFIRSNGQHVFVDYKDFSGDGTAAPTAGAGEAFLDAGSIAAQGSKVYNVAAYSDLPDAETCNIKIIGIAPGVSLVGLDVFGNNAVYNSAFLEAIDYAVTTDHVNVINESFGSNAFPDTASLDLTKQADDAAVAAGVTVSVSSGDSGVTSTIGSPASDPNVISAGASTTLRIDAQTGYGGARLPGVKGWLSNNISSLSSGGQTEAGRSIDLVAPGELNWLPCTADLTDYPDCASYAGNPSAVEATGGTSESAPITSGVAALVIQAYRESHGNATPTPAVVKQILTSTATPIDAPADQEGAGLIDAYQAVLAAKSYGLAASKASGATLLTSPSQLDVTAQPGTAESLTESVVNNGTASATVSATTRTLGAYTSISGPTTVNLASYTGTHPIDWGGYKDNAQSLTFTVPAGEDRLNAAIAFKNASTIDLAARVRLTLVDPLGRLAAYSLPQGDGNYGDVQISRPAAGTWTAYIYSRNVAGGGSTGKVVFGAQVADWTTYGTVTPSSLTLAPGASGTFTVATATPATPGDQSAELVLGSVSGGEAFGTSVPITARSLIPTGTTSFTGTLTGGNGRSTLTGQTAYYQITLPSGLPELNASVNLADNPENPFDALLVDPQGQVESLATNGTIADTAAGPAAVPSLGAQMHVLDPMAGTWDVIIDFLGHVSGTALSEPYTVDVDETAVPSTSAGVPDSTGTTLAEGTPTQATVTVTNDGTAPESYFVDPRLDTTSTIALAPSSGSDVTDIPGSFGVNYVVPTDTTKVTWAAASDVPILSEATYFYGDPDLLGESQGSSAGGSFSAAHVVAGPWAVAPTEIGPFGSAPATPASVTTAMQATTATFDPTVTSATGDLWDVSTDPEATFNVVTVQPGQSAQIAVTITPKGTVGSTVSGTLYVDDANLLAFGSSYTPVGDQVAAVPYSYTIGSGV
jgi:subtilisin family serine protease